MANRFALATGSMMAGYSFVLMVVLALYFTPTVFTVQRRHSNALGVFAFNLLLGWTLLGWAGALVWALANEDSSTGSV